MVEGQAKERRNPRDLKEDRRAYMRGEERWAIRGTVGGQAKEHGNPRDLKEDGGHTWEGRNAG